jgi:hypothetical protein
VKKLLLTIVLTFTVSVAAHAEFDLNKVVNEQPAHTTVVKPWRSLDGSQPEAPSPTPAQVETQTASPVANCLNTLIVLISLAFPVLGIFLFMCLLGGLSSLWENNQRRIIREELNRR